MSDEVRAGHLKVVAGCLSKNIGELDWMTPLKQHSEATVPEKWAAIGFDTNALKQLRRYVPSTRSDILTYLQGEAVPIILPAQAVQEFWNNHGMFTQDVQNVASDARRLAGRFEKLERGTSARATLEDLVRQLMALAGDIEDSQNPNLLRDSISLWDQILPESLIAQMPRENIIGIGEWRMASGIAPGFADDKKKSNRLGDFLVWADFLMGLLQVGLDADGKSETAIVFVTDDGKDDWKTNGAPHPTLLGEIYNLTGRPLVILSMEELRRIAQS